MDLLINALHCVANVLHFVADVLHIVSNISKTSQKLWRLPKRKLIAYIIITCNQSAIVEVRLCWIASACNPVCHIVGTYNIYTIIMPAYNCL